MEAGSDFARPASTPLSPSIVTADYDYAYPPEIPAESDARVRVGAEGSGEVNRAMEYLPQITGDRATIIGPVDRLTDPPRDSDVPARRPLSRFFTHAAPADGEQEVIGFWSYAHDRGEPVQAGADMPLGLMLSIAEEQRPIYDGSHA